MFKSVSRKVVMVALIVTSFESIVFAQRGPGFGPPPAETAPVYPRPGRPGGPGFGRPGHGGPGYNDTQTVQAYIGRSIMNEILPLRRLARLEQYAGYEIVSVSANTRPDSPYRTDVQLIADGYVVAAQINPGYQINLYPQQRLILDQNVRRLELGIRGSTYIDVINITLRRLNQGGGGYPGYPQPQPPQYPPQQPPQQPVPGGTTINGGQVLNMGTTINSSNGQVSLSMQTDCNLVLYSGGRATWATNTVGRQNCTATFQTDGNFVVYSNGSPIWSSGTSRYAGAQMLLQNDGNLVIYAGDRPVWATNTGR